MHDAWTERLSEHLDGSLTGEERALIEAHLATCPACPAVLADLAAVQAAARALPPRVPEADLWPGIEAQIASFARETEGRSSAAPRRGIVLSWPQLAAAGFALVLLSGAASWYAARSGRAPVVAAGGGSDSANARRESNAANASNAGMVDRELADLERVLAEKRGELDPETVQTIEANLKIIDLATTQARAALASDPANPYLKEHLSKTMRRKIEMLKEATVLASTQ